MTNPTAIWWIRRDLRLGDNAALQAALKGGRTVVPVFVLDDHLLHVRISSPRRDAFLVGGLEALNAALRQPLVALTSRLVRRWPRAWYQHRRVLPAHTEVTIAWAVYFLLQAALQGLLFQRQDVTLLAISSLVGGWPATVVLLILSYSYGTWRLARLAGPSLAEFESNAPPPWTGQRRGF
jgi:hypothetical protein